jgi:hypothetical protein
VTFPTTTGADAGRPWSVVAPVGRRVVMYGVFAAGRYVSWGVVSISVANLAIVLVMVAVFVVALLLPFPSEDRDGTPAAGEGRADADGGREP